MSRRKPLKTKNYPHCMRLVVTRDTLAELAPPPGAPQPEIMGREEIDRLLPPGVVHQGIGLRAEPLPEQDLTSLLAASGPDAIFVILDRANDPHNVGAVLRSAAAFGAMAVILPRDHAPSVTGTLAKAASGALELVPLVMVTNLARALDEMKEANVWCVGLAGEADKPLDAIDLKGRVALLVGAEGAGLRRLTREACDFLARLPTDGPVADLNMSNAAAIALYEATRQRRAAKTG
ncbi:MAG: 23S rRNA (guanosine(2251)-2'-O)-methyltransferase RlmB [Alphaproteobacteria bacterium]|nr:23S rRNA (guanosine(2251)-2'-O)-methyltransferase RlmB [Alphaproteobacteria bacterium]